MTVTVAGQVWGRRGCWRPLGLVLLSCTHAISAFQAFTCYCCLLTKSCLTLATPWNVAYRAPLSMGFPRREYWSGVPFPSLLHFNAMLLWLYNANCVGALHPSQERGKKINNKRSGGE